MSGRNLHFPPVAPLKVESFFRSASGIHGFVKDVRPTLPVDLTLANAAMAAVSQWQFTPTLLNCVPVEVNMTATVTFASEH